MKAQNCPVCRGKPEEVVCVMTFDEREIKKLCQSCREKNEFMLKGIKE